MEWLAISSVSAARIGISGWTTIWVFYGLFLLALWILDDPGDDWPIYVLLVAPFLIIFAASLAFVGEGRAGGWGAWVVAYVLAAAATWVSTGPWVSFRTWRRPVLAVVSPLLLGLAMWVGRVVERWLPELLMR